MDWKELGGKITAKGANLLGSAFLGRGAGDLLGSVVGDALGVDGEATPDKISQAIEKDPDAALKLKQIQSEERVKLRHIVAQEAMALQSELTSRQLDVNNSWRKELEGPTNFRNAWRPCFGYAAALGFLSLMLSSSGAVVYLIYFATIGDAASISTLTTGIAAIFGAIMPIMAVGLTVLGVTVKQRTNEKKQQFGGETEPGYIKKLLDKVTSTT